MKNIFFILLFVTIAIPAMAQTRVEKKQIKEEKQTQEYIATNELINSGTFKFEATWANTQKGKRIDLTTNPNYLKLDNETADIYLPYFGVVHSPGAMGGDGGIIVEGKVENYKVDLNEKKRRTTIRFNAKGKNDSFGFTLTVYANGNSNLNVNSNSRNSISYDGEISELEKK